jgi:hypothetical protein
MLEMQRRRTELEERRKAGPSLDLEADYAAFIRDYPDSANGGRIPLAQMHSDRGAYDLVLEDLQPVMYYPGWKPGDKRGIGGFWAFSLYDQALLKTKGTQAQKACRTEMRNRGLYGFSLADYAAKGLDADQALVYLRAGQLDARGERERAYWVLKGLMAERPQSLDAYMLMRNMMVATKRNEELTPMFEDLYRHSTPAFRRELRPQLNLDYAKLDAEGQP